LKFRPGRSQRRKNLAAYRGKPAAPPMWLARLPLTDAVEKIPDEMGVAPDLSI
jgi:hypothetical protein